MPLGIYENGQTPSEEHRLLLADDTEMTDMDHGDGQRKNAAQVQESHREDVGVEDGLSRFMTETENSAAALTPGHVQYKVYKRRWFGLFQLVLLNIIVSWDVSQFYNHPRRHR